MTKPGILSRVTSLVAPSDRLPRSIKAGAFRGIRMQIDLSCQKQLYAGLFEQEVNGWLRRLSSDINTAIDIGAAEGEYTLYFLAKTQAQKVFAFEPLEAERDTLMANLELNSLADDPRLVLSPKFVSSHDNDGECTLDSLVGLISPPCLVKVDVDGAEVDVLQGAREFLRMHQLYWIIETHSPRLENQCMSILTSSGFHTLVVPNAWWRIMAPELRPVEQNRWLVAMKGHNAHG